jgi:hypothetical protein
MERIKAVFNVMPMMSNTGKLFYIDNRHLEEADPRRGIFVTKASGYVDAELSFKFYGVHSQSSVVTSVDPRKKEKK